MRHTVVLPVLVAALVCLAAQAQDKITTAQGVQQGTITHTDENGIWLKTGQAEIQISWLLKPVVEAAVPAELTAAKAAYVAARADATKWAAAAEALRPIVEKYPRLPTAWAEDAVLMLIEATAGAGKLEETDKRVKDFQRWYPQSPSLIKAMAGLGKALAVSKEYDKAIALVEKTIEAKRKQMTVTEADGKSLGAAMNVLGECYEGKGDLPKALEAYVTTKVLYYHDPEAVKIATEKSEVLKPRVAALALMAPR